MTKEGIMIMDELRELIGTVTPGTRVTITNHDYTNDSGTGTVEKIDSHGLLTRRDKPLKSQGRSFRTSYLGWGSPDMDLEVEGRTVRVYNPSHAYVGGRRAIILTLEFGESEQPTEG
jgi:hypothetical protein